MTRSSALDYATVAVALLIAAGAAWMALAGPTEPLPYHFGADGRADAWAGRGFIGGLLACLALAALILGGGMGLAARRSENAARHRALRTGQLLVLVALAGVALFAGVSSATRLDSVGAAGPMAGLSALFLAVGAIVGRVGPNPIAGVRTPWSYKSRLAWDRSNRLAGRLFCLIGLGGLALAPVAPQPLGLQIIIGAVLVAALLSVVESWRVWRTDPDRQPF